MTRKESENGRKASPDIPEEGKTGGPEIPTEGSKPYEGPIEGRCGARLRGKPGKFCQRYPVEGRNRCRLHGGASLLGPASPAYRTGRYSKLLPEGLRKSYDRALQDEDALSVANEVHLIQARIDQLVERLHGQDSSRMWRELSEAWTEFKAANRTKDLGMMAHAGAKIDGILSKCSHEEQQWSELVKMVREKSDIAAKEWRRIVDMQQIITLDKGMVLVNTLSDLVLRHVKDRATRAAIADEINRVLMVGNKRDRDDEVRIGETTGETES